MMIGTLLVLRSVRSKSSPLPSGQPQIQHDQVDRLPAHRSQSRPDIQRLYHAKTVVLEIRSRHRHKIGLVVDQPDQGTLPSPRANHAAIGGFLSGRSRVDPTLND
jgi:hypothetical protein